MTVPAESLKLITFMVSHTLNVVYVVIKLDKKHSDCKRRLRKAFSCVHLGKQGHNPSQSELCKVKVSHKTATGDFSRLEYDAVQIWLVQTYARRLVSS